MRSNSSAEGSFGAGNPARPNIISTGTGPFAFAGVTSVMWIFTLIAGYAELSTCPIRSLAITGVNPIVSRSTAVTVQATFGTPAGTRPYTYLSNNSTISGRRFVRHISAVVTFCPLFNVSGSGISGNGFAFDSS
jgi:hypothetical protein